VSSIYTFLAVPSREREEKMRLATSDLYESGYFLCGGARLAEVIPDRSGASPKIVFTFEGDYGLEEMRKNYWNGNATVNLAEYRRSLETLKDIMFRHIRGGTGAGSNGEKRRRERNGFRTRQAV